MRISHETTDGTSKSPDAPVSDEGQHPISEPATPSDVASSSRSDITADRGVPPSHYLDPDHDLGMVNHAGSSYHHQIPRQDYYNQGQLPPTQKCAPWSTLDGALEYFHLNAFAHVLLMNIN
jgi:hypothetical protein